MVDPSRIRAKLTALDRYLSRLHELAAMDIAVYVDDRAYEGRYLMQAAAQACIDMANHVIASEGWVPALEFREAFSRLGDHGVLSADHVGRMQDLTGLRNRLVHLYDDVDDRIVHEALLAGLPDLERFASAIAGSWPTTEPARPASPWRAPYSLRALEGATRDGSLGILG